MVVSSRFFEATGVAAGVEQGEAAGAVGRLHHARREAGLADGRGLLVAGDAADRDRAAEQGRRGRAELGGAILHLGQHRARHAAGSPAARRPSAGVDVEQQRARGVGGVGGVHLAAGQPPEQEAVDGAERELAALGARRARRGRCRGSRRSWCRRNRGRGAGRSSAEIAGSWPSAFSFAQMSAVRRSCQTMARWIGLPVARSQTTVVSRWLVMPMAAMSLALDAGLAERLAADRRRSRSRCPPARARPSRRPGNAAGTPAAPSRRWRCRRETRWRGRRWCPGRWRGRRTWKLTLAFSREGVIVSRQRERIGAEVKIGATRAAPLPSPLAGEGGAKRRMSGYAQRIQR